MNNLKLTRANRTHTYIITQETRFWLKKLMKDFYYCTKNLFLLFLFLLLHFLALLAAIPAFHFCFRYIYIYIYIIRSLLSRFCEIIAFSADGPGEGKHMLFHTYSSLLERPPYPKQS